MYLFYKKKKVEKYFSVFDLFNIIDIIVFFDSIIYSDGNINLNFAKINNTLLYKIYSQFQ